MSGIVFFGTGRLNELKDFYLNQIGCRLWLEQADCAIFCHGNFLFGFCRRSDIETEGIITFFFDKKIEVDMFYEKFRNLAESTPVVNEKYNIYHFFVHDPEGRKVEFQYFEHPVKVP